MTSSQSSVQGVQYPARRRGLSPYAAAQVLFGTPISKNIEVAHSGGSSYFVTIADAKRLTATGQAKWDGPKRIVLNNYESKRASWICKGEYPIWFERKGYGPKAGVLQMV